MKDDEILRRIERMQREGPSEAFKRGLEQQLHGDFGLSPSGDGLSEGLSSKARRIACKCGRVFNIPEHRINTPIRCHICGTQFTPADNAVADSNAQASTGAPQAVSSAPSGYGQDKQDVESGATAPRPSCKPETVPAFDGQRTVISCPTCAQKLRVPTDRGKLRAACPECHTAFDYDPCGPGTPALQAARGVAAVRAALKYTTIHEAAIHDDCEDLNLHLQAGADVNSTNFAGGRTPLMLAAIAGPLAMSAVRWLVENGADVNVKASDGSSALMNAAFKGTLPSVRCLVDNGADVNARDEDGATALELAVSGGHWEVVKWLLDKGADVNTRDRFGKTPLTMAASRGLLQIAELLKRHGAKG